MIIGIDGNEANVEKRVGISEYVFELLRQFGKYKSENLKFKIYLKNNPLVHMPSANKNWEYKIFGPKKMWTQFGLPLKLFLEKEKPDIFFTPTHYAPRFSPISTVISIMDLAYLKYPEMFTKKDLYQLKNWTSYSVKNAKLVFTISQSSKNDIIRFYNIDSQKIKVIYPGIKSESEIMKNKLSFKEVSEKYNISKNFILFVGTLQPRKNITKLIEALSLLLNKDGGIHLNNKNLQLIIVGKKGWQYEEILSAPEKFGVTENVKFLDFVSNDELDILYKNALVFCLPSLYEGFGLPVLEAMQKGCPVITSNVSSLPEAGGSAALYFDPNNTNDIANKLEVVILNKKLRNEMIRQGYEHIKKFSWDKSAKETLKALEDLYAK